ncbi:hypothetical protein UFOVP457_52 [uncultured Caudovirales phage]|uniref:Uncharacterized protein n=1 Tax=uncultured Caudovirales phage TaxID=2100421 RepID=A0A6J5MLW2_9CAUD|nr:hypothetical protein UFOVP457_52 [uncultured Caudovirales phage]
MNKDEHSKEKSRILHLEAALGQDLEDLSEQLRELKIKLLDYGNSLAITNFNCDPNEKFVVYWMGGAFDFSSVWWPIFVDFGVYDKNRKVEGMKTFYEYIQEAYGVGFVELLLNTETGEKTNRWDLAEIAMFNWLVAQAKLLNWNFIPSEKPTKSEVLVPEHYRESGSDIEKVMLATHFNVFLAELPPNLAAELKAESAAKNALSKALWAAMAMKHLCRAGTKADNPVDLELGKVENYSHRARTGEWK